MNLLSKDTLHTALICTLTVAIILRVDAVRKIVTGS